MKSVSLIAALVLSAVCLSPARALHREDIPILVRLAHDLEQRAEHALVAADAQAHHFTGREVRMLRSLQHFRGQAGRFHWGIERYFSSPHEVEDALAELNEDADRVERVIYRSHTVSNVVADWSRAASLLRQINGYFGAEAAPHGGGAGHHGW